MELKKAGGKTKVVYKAEKIVPLKAREQLLLLGDSVKAFPFLKWAGGKTQLIEQYQPFLPKKFKKYYEPFVGSGAVFFNLHPPSACLIDSNQELINCYKVIQNNVRPLIRLLKVFERLHSPENYYLQREQYNKLVATSQKEVRRAALLIYLNKTCYNGLYRVNSQGGFNTPVGSYKNPLICNENNLYRANRVLRNTELMEGDFEVVLNKAERGDFIYFDPPYHPLSETSNFVGYTHPPFGEEGQIRLNLVFKELVRRDCHVLVSNSDTSFIRKLYRGCKIITVQARRFINSDSSKRGLIDEVLILGNING